MFLFFDFLLVCVVKQKLSLDSKETLNVSNYHDIYTERGLTVFPPGGREFQLGIHINFPRERYDIENVSFTIDQTVSFMVYLTTEEQESITVNMHFITIIYQFKDCIKMPGILSLFINLSTGEQTFYLYFQHIKFLLKVGIPLQLFNFLVWMPCMFRPFHILIISQTSWPLINLTDKCGSNSVQSSLN